MNETQVKSHAKEVIIITSFTCIICLLIGSGTIYIYPDLINRQYFPESFKFSDYVKVLFFNVATFWAGVALGVVGMIDKLLRKSDGSETE